MRIVATADTHFVFDKDDYPAGDVFVHAGDFMYSGYLDEWHARVASFAALEYEHKILVPGNHDIHLEKYAGPALQDLRKAGVDVVGPPSKKYFHKIALPNGMTLGGCPYVTDLPGWAFNWDEDSIWGFLDTMGRVDVLVAHSPPAGLLDGRHYGTKALRKYIYKFEPQLLICGHVHESYGTKQCGKTLVANVARCNGDYEQVNPPMVFDL